MAAWTAAEVKTNYVEFAAVSDGTVNVYIARASAEINETTWGTRAKWAGMALTAHFMALDSLGTSGGSPGGSSGAGAVSAMTVGGVSVSYDTSGSSAAVDSGYAADLTKTRYGLEYVRLSKLQMQGMQVL